MGTIGLGEIVFLTLLALLIFGPERLPEMARSAGRVLAQLKREATDTVDELKKSADFDELRGVADEVRGAGERLERTGRDLGRSATSALPAGATAAGGEASPDRPPFDPDAP